MTRRRILFVELVEETPDPGFSGEVKHAIRLWPKWVQTIPPSDRGVAALLLSQLVETLVIHAGPVWVEPLEPSAFEVDGALERVEAEGLAPSSLAQRALDLETLCRAARVRSAG